MTGERRMAELYHSDFYAWTQDQAARLRALAGDNRLDVEHLADEVADLGRSERNKVQQNLVQVLVHALKAVWSPATDPRAHWREDVLRHQQDARDAFTPSMRQHLDVDEIWLRAVKLTNAALRDHGEPPLPAEMRPPVSLDALLHREMTAEWLEGRIHAALGGDSDERGLDPDDPNP